MCQYIFIFHLHDITEILLKVVLNTIIQYIFLLYEIQVILQLHLKFLIEIRVREIASPVRYDQQNLGKF